MSGWVAAQAAATKGQCTSARRMQTPTARWSHTDGAQRNLTEQAATTAIDTACRLLRLPSIRNGFAQIADRAAKDQMTYRGFLAELLMTECDDRARHRSECRIKAAGFPRDRSIRLAEVVAKDSCKAAVRDAADASGRRLSAPSIKVACSWR